MLRWLAWLCGWAMLALMGAGSLRAQSLEAAPPATRPVDLVLSVLVEDDIRRLAQSVEDDATPPWMRQEYARRLTERRDPLSDALAVRLLANSGRPRAQEAIARALGVTGRNEARWVDPLFALLDDNRDLAAAAAAALDVHRDNQAVLARARQLAADVDQPEVVRVSALRILGGRGEHTAARTLVEVYTQAPPGAVRDAASAALHRLSPQADPRFADWTGWWREHAPLEAGEWAVRVAAWRAQAAAQAERRGDELLAEVAGLLAAAYRNLPADRQAGALLTYLRSGAEQVRAEATRLVQESFTGGEVIPPAVRDQLRLMVGDSSVTVRLRVARTLFLINDADALVPLLTQLGQERNTAVKAEVARALGPIRDLRAAPALVALLADESPLVVEAAAQSLGPRQLGPVIRREGAGLARETAQRLVESLRRHARSQVTVRRALVEALAPVADAPMVNVFIELLAPDEPEQIRRAALTALGEIGDVRAADTIALALADREAVVRREAASALGKTRSVAHAQQLFTMFQGETDADVRAVAWEALLKLLPLAPLEQLTQWPDRFKDDAPRRLTVLQLVEKRQADARDGDGLAYTRQGIGEVLAGLQRYSDAADSFRLALDHWRTEKNDVGVEGLLGQWLDAMLRARRFRTALADTAEFIRQDIAADATNRQKMQTLGTQIRKATERLKGEGRPADLQAALQLIEESRRLDPPLPESYQEDLRRIDDEIRQRLAASTQPATSTQPR